MQDCVAAAPKPQPSPNEPKIVLSDKKNRSQIAAPCLIPPFSWAEIIVRNICRVNNRLSVSGVALRPWLDESRPAQVERLTSLRQHQVITTNNSCLSWSNFPHPALTESLLQVTCSQ